MALEKLRNGFGKIHDFFTTSEGTSVTYQSRTYTFQRSKPLDNLKFLGSLIKNVVKDRFKTRAEDKTPGTNEDGRSLNVSDLQRGPQTTNISTRASHAATPILSPVQSQTINTPAPNTVTTQYQPRTVAIQHQPRTVASQYQPIPTLATQATSAHLQSMVPASVPARVHVPQPANVSVYQNNAELQEILSIVGQVFAGFTYDFACFQRHFQMQLQEAANRLIIVRRQGLAPIFAYRGKNRELKVKVNSQTLGKGTFATVIKVDTLFRENLIKIFKTKAFKIPNEPRYATEIERGITVRDWLYPPTEPKRAVVGLLPYWKIKKVSGLSQPSKAAVLTFYKGGNLENVAAQQKLSAKQKNQMVIDTLYACMYAHQRGVYLTDIKPGNMLVDDQGNVVLADLDGAFRLNSELLKNRAEKLDIYKYQHDENYRKYIFHELDLKIIVTMAYVNSFNVDAHYELILNFLNPYLNPDVREMTEAALKENLEEIDSFALGLSYAEVFLGRTIKNDAGTLHLTPEQLQDLRSQLRQKGATSSTANVIIGLLNHNERLTVEQAYHMLNPTQPNTSRLKTGNAHNFGESF
jgi:hypothetical protein